MTISKEHLGNHKRVWDHCALSTYPCQTSSSQHMAFVSTFKDICQSKKNDSCIRFYVSKYTLTDFVIFERECWLLTYRLGAVTGKRRNAFRQKITHYFTLNLHERTNVLTCSHGANWWPTYFIDLQVFMLQKWGYLRDWWQIKIQVWRSLFCWKKNQKDINLIHSSIRINLTVFKRCVSLILKLSLLNVWFITLPL